MPFCMECGRELQRDWKACPFCGISLVGDVPRTCESCGKELEKDWITCPLCGSGEREETEVVEKRPKTIRDVIPRPDKWIVPLIKDEPKRRQPVGAGGAFVAIIIIIVILLLVFVVIVGGNWAQVSAEGVCGFIPASVLGILSLVWYRRRCPAARPQ